VIIGLKANRLAVMKVGCRFIITRSIQSLYHYFRRKAWLQPLQA
jgi:hypothetical protein